MIPNAKPSISKVRLKSRERLNLFTDISTMLGAGIPILEAVESLNDDAKGNNLKVIKVIRAALLNGEPLSYGLERMPNAFDPITVNLIRAAESSGTLEDILKDLVQTTRKEIAFNDSLRTTMIYPAFVMVLFTAIVVLMLTFVIPRVAKVFLGMRVHLPLVTKIMFASSSFFMHHWLIISAAFIGLLFAIGVFITTRRRLIVRMILDLPGFRGLGRNIDLTRLTRSFSLLLHAGLPLDEALVLTKRVVQKKQTIAVIELMRENLNAGRELGTGLKEHKDIIPPMMARSIETAEASGTLEETMQRLSEYFDDQVNERLKVISSLIEPALLVVVGVFVGALMITIIAPIYNLISQINGKHY